MSKPRTPPKLGPRAGRFWRDVVGKYDLRFDELLILEEACREVDLIDRLSEELATSSLRTKGSMGQDVADPMVTELRQHRNTLKALVTTLKLPDDPAGEQGAGATSASSAAVAMNRARWSKPAVASGT